MEHRTFLSESGKLSKFGDHLEWSGKSINCALFCEKLKRLFYEENKGLGGHHASQ